MKGAPSCSFLQHACEGGDDLFLSRVGLRTVDLVERPRPVDLSTATEQPCWRSGSSSEGADGGLGLRKGLPCLTLESVALEGTFG